MTRTVDGGNSGDRPRGHKGQLDVGMTSNTMRWLALDMQGLAQKVDHHFHDVGARSVESCKIESDSRRMIGHRK